MPQPRSRPGLRFPARSTIGWRQAVRAFCAGCLLSMATGPALAVPEGFVDDLVASGLRSPTAMAFAPDGRLVVTEQGGTARIIVGGVLQSTPFATMTVDPNGERGLLGVAFHPTSHQRLYLLLPHHSGQRRACGA